MWKKAGIFNRVIRSNMKKVFFLAFCMLMGSVINAQKTYIWCGALIDGIGNNPRANITIVVEGNKIIAIENGFSTPGKTDKTIDLKSKTVTPGWIDMHVHIEIETNPNRYMETFTFNPADYAFQSVKFAETTLLAGFTTVRDLGGSGVNISLRNAINKGSHRRRFKCSKKFQ